MATTAAWSEPGSLRRSVGRSSTDGSGSAVCTLYACGSPRRVDEAVAGEDVVDQLAAALVHARERGFAGIRGLTAHASVPYAILLADIDNSAILRRESIATKLRVLDQIVRNVRSHLEPGGELLDLGASDEFFVLVALASEDVEAEAAATAEAIRAIVGEGTWLVGDSSFRVTASIGIALSPVDARDAHTLMLLAHSACRAAKALGKNRCERAEQGFRHMLRTQVSLARRRQLVDLSVRTGQPMDALVRRAIDLVLQRHSGLEQFCDGIKARW